MALDTMPRRAALLAQCGFFCVAATAKVVKLALK
jgi:hypothetical protein